MLSQQCQLITYPDSLGGSLPALERVLTDEFPGLFPGGIHVLPPFPSSGDRGFAPIAYDQIAAEFGGWTDLERIARHGGLMVDVMVNHISRHSREFKEFEEQGRSANNGDLFITLDKVWPEGRPPAEDVDRLFLRKPDHPFSKVRIGATGETEQIWTTFGAPTGPSEQIDLDVRSNSTWRVYEKWLSGLASHGVSMVRMDAVGYVTKRAGTDCFMVEPDIWDFMHRFSELASTFGLEIVPEVHGRRQTFESITQNGYPTYNFVLPGIIIHALQTQNAELLCKELSACPDNQITVLDCHDGIPIQPDLTETLSEQQMIDLVGALVDRGANLNRIIGARPGAFDAHQVNITYPDACGSEDAFLIARAIQLFAPGTPQIYYVGLLGGSADDDSVARTGDGRAVNRHNYDESEIVAAQRTSITRRQVDLIELRNTHPAFGGSQTVTHHDSARSFAIEWTNGSSRCRLDVDLGNYAFAIETS